MWVYNPNLFDSSTIKRLASTYEHLLNLIATDPHSKISSLFSALEETEQEQRSKEQEQFQKAGLEKLRKIRRKPIEV
jgi:hypothetical protein